MGTRALLPALALALALGFAPGAKASPVIVKYALTGTAIFAGGPAGPTGAGMATFTFTGTPGSGIVPGPFHLLSLTFAQEISLTTATYSHHITGGVAFALSGSGMGTLFTGGGLYAGGVPAAFVAGVFHCASGGCPTSATFPLGTPASASFGGLVTGTFLTLYMYLGGSGIGVGVLPFSFTGTEVSRIHVPEPSTLPLLGFAAAGLAASGLGWRLRRRRAAG